MRIVSTAAMACLSTSMQGPALPQILVFSFIHPNPSPVKCLSDKGTPCRKPVQHSSHPDTDTMPIIASFLSSLFNPAPKPPTSPPAPTTPIQQHPHGQPSPPPPPPPQNLQQPSLAPTDPQQQQQQRSLPPHSFFTPRSYKQLSLFLAGATFLGLTTALTRRSVARKIRDAAPRFYEPSYLGAAAAASKKTAADSSAEGTLFALEALSLATLNTFAFGIMAAGGLAWAFDISTLDDLRARARRHQKAGGGTRVEGDEEAEETIEEWMASVLGKDEKEGREERDAKEWMARLLVKAKDKAEEEGKK